MLKMMGIDIYSWVRPEPVHVAIDDGETTVRKAARAAAEVLGLDPDRSTFGLQGQHSETPFDPDAIVSELRCGEPLELTQDAGGV